MSEELCWLITVLYGNQLIKCALKVARSALPGDCALYPMEPENRAAIYAMLPAHVQSCGPIVAVEELFEVVVVDTPTPARCGSTEHVPSCAAEAGAYFEMERKEPGKRCGTCEHKESQQ